MKNLCENWVLEWNSEEDAFDPCSWRITRYHDLVKSNIQVVTECLASQDEPWLLMAVTSSYDGACELADSLRAQLRKIKRVKKDIGEMSNGSNKES